MSPLTCGGSFNVRDTPIFV